MVAEEASSIYSVGGVPGRGRRCEGGGSGAVNALYRVRAPSTANGPCSARGRGRTVGAPPGVVGEIAPQP
eukprot:2418867-Pyramimonas_sp.AAC.1